MAISIARVARSGGLLSEHRSFRRLLHAYFKGHVEAIVSIVDHSHYLHSSMDFVKLNWKLTYNVFL